jgi:hypothetical protein
VTGPSGFEPRATELQETGAQGFLLTRCVGAVKTWLAKSCPDFPGLVKVQEALATRASVSKIIVENHRLVLEFNNPDKMSKFVESLKLLGVTNNVERKKIRIRCDEAFRLYLERDRELHKRTVRDCMIYLKKLSGKVINYYLYRERAHRRFKLSSIPRPCTRQAKLVACSQWLCKKGYSS